MFSWSLKNAKQRLVITGALLAFFLFLAVSVLLRTEDCLIAECGGKPLFAWPIEVGCCFEVTFMHSLNLSPITDVIEWTGYDLVVRKSIFTAFGAGVPTPSDGIGTDLVFVDGRYELLGIDKHMESFTIMTQTVPDHRIYLNGREARLLELAGSGKAVDIAVRRMSLIRRLFYA
ncbi:MAG: DUF1850 domain-containing protein [Peptococcaceae bacterium]|jgi:hypothetical protein|nr:DUF1850 domain-containing protein [Peptococcaceae bacterium]